MMQELFSALPDDRPITSVIVVEDPTKCPSGYTIVSKTYDQDIDADLYKDGFWGRRITRYLGLSKTEGKLGYIIESVAIINEKELPPDGFTLVSHTEDTEQLAWKKKQLYYRLASRSTATQAITDIIVLSKVKQAPEGFILAGEMNGLLLCYKTGSAQSSNFNSPMRGGYPLPYGITPVAGQQTHIGPGYPNGSPYMNRPLPNLPNQGISGTTSTAPGVSGVYPARAARPARPAPQPPPLAQAQVQQSATAVATSSTNTLGLYSGLEGVPFILNPKFRILEELQHFCMSDNRIKTSEELENEYNYNFTTEYEAQQRIPSE